MSTVFDAAAATANAARIVRSCRLLQERFGQRHGQGDAVELWHALEDLARVAGDLQVDVSRLVQRPKRVPSQAELLDGLLEGVRPLAGGRP